MNNQTLQLIATARSRRSFVQDETLPDDLHTEIVDALRLSPSAGTKQTIRIMLLAEPNDCDAIFHMTRWAAYLTDGAPKPGHRPAAYAILLNDTSRGQLSPIDLGIAAQSINLTCCARGFACCMIGAFDKAQLSRRFIANDSLTPELVIAIGRPDENIAIETLTDSVKYWRTPDGTHHVPKRRREDLIAYPSDSLLA